MADDYLQVALITEVFFDDPTGERLQRALVDAQSRGADLALLPEIPSVSYTHLRAHET